jgi:N-methylhydantoinase A
MAMTAWMVGVDTGGTFTDLVALNRDSGELRETKVQSVPADPSQAVMNALEELFATGVNPGDVAFFVHGTTVATNAILEGKGARTGLLITRGFRGVYEARGWSLPSAVELIDPFYRKPPMLAPQRLTEEITGRIDFRGEVLTELVEDDVRCAVQRLKAHGIQSLAVCFLFSFLNPAHERRAGEIAAKEAPDWRISLSSDVLPIIREYNRLSTTVIDAYVGPLVESHLRRLSDRLKSRGVTTPQVFMMQSNGGLTRISVGAHYPNQLLLSGPAAGVIAGNKLAASAKESHIVTFDMGGTSADIAVSVDGRMGETTTGRVAGQDIGTPMLKVRTLGAGGGTIAWIGRDGLLKVGPQSAGAVPGPAAYGRGGQAPTVTDANLILGALGSTSALAGKLKLDEGCARAALDRVGKPLGLDAVETAAGIIRIVNTNMAIDLRLALQEEGQDPRRFVMVAFGGAGPLHAGQIARMVGIRRVYVPRRPGLNCATGLLQTSVRHTYLQSAVATLSSFPVERMNALFEQLRARALADAAEEGFAATAVQFHFQVEMRYLHQGYQLAVDCPVSFREDDKPALKRAFDTLHRQTYGQSADAEEAEIVSFRLQAEIAVPQFELPALPHGDGDFLRAKVGMRQLFDTDSEKFVTATVYERDRLMPGDRLPGPAIMQQFDTTTVVLGRQVLSVDSYGALIVDTETQ